MTSFRHTHVDDPSAVGSRLREAREHAGLSQRQLAFEGCSPAYISRLEAGQRVPSLQLLRKIASKLGVDENFLATGQRTERVRPQVLVDAEIALRLDELDVAEDLYERLLQTTSDIRLRSESLAGLGQVAFRRGDPKSAVASIEEAFELDRSLAVGVPGLVETLGRGHATLGQMESAIGVFQRALDAAVTRDDAFEIRRFGVLLANALIDSGNFGRADEILGDAIARANEGDDHVSRARVLWSQSRLHSMKGDQELAAIYARRTLELLELTEDVRYRARAFHLLGYIELERGRPTEALEAIRHGREVLGDDGTPIELAQFRLEEARALAQLGETERAASEAMAVSALLTEADPHDAGRCYALIGDVFVDLGQRERAREVYELAIELLETEDNPHVASVWERLAKLYEEEGRTDEALQALKRALGSRERASQHSGN
jgi:tetratricopeptide (TPR) repeat protein